MVKIWPVKLKTADIEVNKFQLSLHVYDYLQMEACSINSLRVEVHLATNAFPKPSLTTYLPSQGSP